MVFSGETPPLARSIAEQERCGAEHEDNLDADVHKGAESPTAEQLIQSQINNIKIQQKQHESAATRKNDEGLKRAQEANKELKKFITTLTFTSQIEKIFDTVEKTTIRAHESAWELNVAEHLLKIVAATRRGDMQEVDRLMLSFSSEGRRLQEAVKEDLMDAKKAVIKQCEEGVERMLEALEKTSL